MADAEAIRAALEEARAALDESRAEYRELFGGMTDEDLSRRPPGYTWTNRQTAWHLAFLQNRIPRTAPRIRSGRGMDPPKLVWRMMGIGFDVYAKLSGRRANRERLLAWYDEGHQAAVALLDDVGEDEWERRAPWLGGQASLADQFGFLRAHFSEHAADLRKSLG